jgi:hypothetical protein
VAVDSVLNISAVAMAVTAARSAVAEPRHLVVANM